MTPVAGRGEIDGGAADRKERLLARCTCLALVVTLLATPAPARADPAGQAGAIVSAFAALRQGVGGNVIDPVSHANAFPYSQAMLGEASLATWRATRDPVARAFGERMLRWASEHPSGPVPSYFALGAAARAYAMLPADSGVREPLRQWLTAFPLPRLDEVAYHGNHDLVLAEALFALGRLRLRPDSTAVRATARHLLYAHMLRRAPRHSLGPGGRRVTILVDPPHAPSAYQELVLGYLARMVALHQVRDRSAIRHLLAAARGSLAMVAPDGDAAYWGRSQEESWAVVLGAYGLRVAARYERDAGEAARFRAAADAMFGRYERVYAGGPYAVRVVPAMVADPLSRPPGIDAYANVATYAGLTAVALTWLAGEPATGGSSAGRAVASLFPIGEDAFATVRRGDVWFAVREHGAFGHSGDLRSDFGLLAAELRRTGTGWAPLVAVRPFTSAGMDSAGPVLHARGLTGFPDGSAMRLDRDRALVISGGWRDRAGRWLRRAEFRLRAVAGGVALSFPVRRGDRIDYSVFADAPRAVRNGVLDERARTTLTPGAIRYATTAGFASSDSSHLTRATITTAIERSGRLTITVRHDGR